MKSIHDQAQNFMNKLVVYVFIRFAYGLYTVVVRRIYGRFNKIRSWFEQYTVVSRNIRSYTIVYDFTNQLLDMHCA